jgi:hypothetical protein
MPNQFTGVKAQRLDRCRQYLYKFLDTFKDDAPKKYRDQIPEILEAIRYLLIIEGVYHRTYKAVLKEHVEGNKIADERRENEIRQVESILENIPVDLLIKQAREEAEKRAKESATEPTVEGQ